MARARFDVEKLLADLEPTVRRAFERAIADITSEAQLALIAGHLARGDIDAAVIAANLRPEFLAPLDDALLAVQLEAGRRAMAGLPAIPDPFPGGAWSRALMVATLARKRG